MIRVVVPSHLRTLAKVDDEVVLEITGQVTQRSVLDALEARYPALRGAIRDHATKQRRPFLRFFACGEDLSLEEPDAPLPEAVATAMSLFSWLQQSPEADIRRQAQVVRQRPTSAQVGKSLELGFSTVDTSSTSGSGVFVIRSELAES
jgi:molybdopterin converting factor small subunit